MDAREVEKRKKKKILTAAVLVLLTAAVLVFCAVYADSIKRVASDPAFVRGWFRAHEPYGTLVYCFVTVVQILLAFLPGEPLELAAGYAFGAVKGSLLCLLAEGAGSVLVLLLVRRFGPGIVRLFFSEEQLERLRFLHYSPKRLLLFAIIFMMPGTPKDLLCYFAGLTDIDINKLIIICTVGRIPSILTSTLGGNAIGEQRYVFAIVVFLVTALLSVAGIAFYNYICSKHAEKK